MTFTPPRAHDPRMTGEAYGGFGGVGTGRADSWLPLLPAALLYPVGTVLMQQGGDPGDVFYVEEGLAKLVRTDSDGREQILGLRGAGWFLGAALVLALRAHPASAVAVTPCRLRRLTRETFLDLMARHEGLSWHVHQMHSREVLSQFEQMADLGTATSRQRLERILRRLTKASPPSGAAGVRLSLPLKRWELASLIAVTPEHLSRLLRRLRDDGLIRIDDGYIFIPDVRRLAPGDVDGGGVLTNAANPQRPAAMRC